MKTQWELTALYTSLDDPHIERDMRDIAKQCEAFERKFKTKAAFLRTDMALLAALRSYEALYSKVAGAKPLVYVWYRQALDSSDNNVSARLNQLSEQMTIAQNKLLFFEIALGELPRQRRSALLKKKQFARYAYFLERVFKEKDHMLSEAEERIMSRLSLPSRELWNVGMEKLLNSQTVLFEKKQLPLAEATNMISMLPVQKRRALHASTMQKLKDVSYFAESELNALVLDKKIRDELRGYPHPYSETILRYQNNEASVLGMVSTVTKRFDIAHRFYRLKKRALGLSTLMSADRAVSIGTTHKKITFQDAYTTLHTIFQNANPIYSDILKTMVESGRVDVYPRKGKHGGAFCSHTLTTPTVVLLNHVDDHRSLLTFAHEMGHAIHSERSRSQPPLYADYSTAVAETASTFFEALTFSELFKTLSPSEQIIALHDALQDDISTVFRQVAFFNFEIELHTSVRKEGALSKERLAELFRKHIQSYCGDALTQEEVDGYFFVYVSHFRNFFYVYSYAFGQLISKALIARYEKDHSYIEQIDHFLSAGASNTPEKIFAAIGINTLHPAFFEEGLAMIEHRLDTLEQLLNAVKKGKKKNASLAKKNR